MPEVVETASVSAVAVVAETPLHDPVTGAFLPGHKGMGGRPKGSRTAAKCLDRAAPSLARRMIARSFKSDTVLCRTMDKILPDAGSTTGMVVQVSLVDGLRLLSQRAQGLPPTPATLIEAASPSASTEPAAAGQPAQEERPCVDD